MNRALAAFGRVLIAASVLGPLYAEYILLWLADRYLGLRLRPEQLEHVHRRNARRFFRLAVRLQGGMIKVGQLISTRADVVPTVWLEELSGLQDSVPAKPFHVIRAHLRETHGRDPGEVFQAIEETPVAAASFGQVHRVTTHDGERLALKVRYPDIAHKLDVDLFIFRVATPLFNVFVPKVNLLSVYREMKSALHAELDYEREAENTARIGENLESVPGVVVPRVYHEYCTDSVIATAYFEGYKVTDRERVRALGVAPEDLLDRVLAAWLKMVYEDGFFQSDPHPGNLLFNAEDGSPTLCVIDFGQVKQLRSDFHEVLVQAATAFLTRNGDGLEAAIVELGMLSAEDARSARPYIDDFFSRYFHLTPAQAREVDFDRVRRDLFEFLRQVDGVTIPQDLVLHGRTISLLAGIASFLDDSQNLLILAQPHLMRAMAKKQREAKSNAA